MQDKEKNKIENLSCIEDEIESLKSLIKKYNESYYLKNQSEISDAQFDLLNLRLNCILKEYPHLSEKINESELLGTKSDFPESKKKSHIKPMFSLQNAFNFEDLIEFDKRVHRFLNVKMKNSNGSKNSYISNFEYCVEQKYDGLSFSALYIDGVYKLGLTRGDGVIGEDITENLRGIENWPEKLNISSSKKPPNKIEIRGEVFMPIAKFHELNSILEKNGEKKFVNPRNAASGSLRILDSKDAQMRGLEYFAYNIGYIDNEFEHIPKKQSEILLFLKNLGFKISENFFVSNNLDEIHKFYNEELLKRDSLSYEIDGLVIKTNDLNLQEKLGETGKYPRWAIAFKFPSNQGFTRLLDVSFGIGRTGAITPVAHLESVNLSGANITRASLHNFDEIKKLDVHINDIVNVKRSGDVIPQIVCVIFEKRLDENEKENFSRRAVEMPKFCPSCESHLFKPESEAVLRCTNYNCKAKMIEYLKYFCSRDALNIVGMGEKQIHYFFENAFILGPLDIFDLENKFSDVIKKLPNWGEKSASNLFMNIEKAKNITLIKFIYSLGIRFNGEVGSTFLAKFFKTASNFVDFAKSFSENQIKNQEILSEISEINGFGEKGIISLKEFFGQIENVNLTSSLGKILKVSDYADQSSLDSNSQEHILNPKNIFYKKNLVFTGSLEKMSRQGAKEISVKSLFANVQSDVSKATNFLIFGDKPGSKLKKALDVGARIMSEDEFMMILAELCI